MRDQGGGLLFSPPIEKKKVSVKLSGREEGNEGVRRRPGYGESNFGGGGKLTGSVVTVGSSGRLKGGSSVPSSSNGGRHHSEELHLERLSAGTGKPAEDGLLPQWGRGKRSRCSRPEPSNKQSPSPPVQESVPPSKSAPPSLKKPFPNGVSSSKLHSHGASKLPASSKLSAPERPASRNGLTNNTVNGPIHAIGFDSVRQVAEVKEAVLLTHQRRSADYSSCRQQQRSEGSDFATTNTGHGHYGDNAAIINTGNGTPDMVVSVSEANALDCNKPKVEWPRIAIALTRKEKEEDFLVFKGSKLSQRPKKRPKVVEKALLFCTPGNWLGDLTRGRYEVREKKSTKKKPRGLKAMDSVESDSE
eukprot:c16774_g2_i1 orf=529-1608(-)